MSPINEPLSSIQARVEELQSTIAEKEEHIKASARHFKDELKEEVSPLRLVRRYPLQSVGVAALAGVALGRRLRRGNRASSVVAAAPVVQSNVLLSTTQTLLSVVGMELMRSLKEIGLSYLKQYIEKKIR